MLTLHTLSENRNKIKRDIGRHILNNLNFDIKKKNLKSDPSYRLLKMALSTIDSLTEIFIQWVYTNTLQPQTLRNAIMFWKGKIIYKFTLQQINSEEKPHKVLIVESFEGDNEKAQYAYFKHIFI